MNTKELEALVIKQGSMVESLQELCKELHKRVQDGIEAHMHLVQRADNIVEGFKLELAGRDELIRGLTGACTMTQETQHAMRQDTVNGMDIAMKHADRIETMEKLVLARNASAATKRNMTDQDALQVLTGDVKDLSHKDAAEKTGLTYAQVYSCRLGFTFKHVHKALRDAATADAPWINPWTK